MRSNLSGESGWRALRAIAEPNRRRILHALRNRHSCCGMPGLGLCESGVRQCLSISQPTVSHHLAVLREVGLIGTERKGQRIRYYRLENSIRQLVRFVRDEVVNTEMYNHADRD